MVKKLIKHEFHYYFRTLIIFLPIILVIGLFVRIFSLFDHNFIGYKIIISSSFLLLYFSSLAIFLFVEILSIVRFYKNMYSSEGYLTFSLPVNTFQLIFSKLVGSIVSLYITSIVVDLAGMIAGTNFLNIDLSEIALDISELLEVLNGGHLFLYSLELIVFAFLVQICNLLIIYACITIGQTAKKNRILFSVGAYFVYYIITQVILTFLMVLITILGSFGALNWIGDFLISYPYLFFHILFIVLIVITCGMIVLSYYIIHKIINTRLNLE